MNNMTLSETKAEITQKELRVIVRALDALKREAELVSWDTEYVQAEMVLIKALREKLVPNMGVF